MSKKELVKLAGYPNMRQLCKANPDLPRSAKKRPSRKKLVRILS